MALDRVRANLLQPLGLDARNAAAKQAAGVDHSAQTIHLPPLRDRLEPGCGQNLMPRAP